MQGPLIDVILTENTRPACGGPFLILYSAGGVFLCLEKKGFNVRFIDHLSEEKKGLSHDEKDRRADIICYPVFFGNKVSAFKHMKKARDARGAPSSIIAFGTFAAAFPELMLARGLADIIVLADPEFVIPKVVEAKNDPARLADIPNIVYRQDGRVMTTSKHSFDDLDAIPFVGEFLYSDGEYQARMLTARGCQYHCVFCDRNALWGGGVRQRSVENVISEVSQLVLERHVPKIRFIDEDMAADRRRLARICDGIRRIPGDFSWECSACVDSVNEEILMLMGRSKCSAVFYGVESASSGVLHRIGKRYAREDIIKAVQWTRNAGMHIEAMITTGNPGETDDDRRQTLSLLQELKREITTITTNRLVILPGTPIYRQALREGRFTDEGFFDDEGIIFYDEKKQAV